MSFLRLTEEELYAAYDRIDADAADMQRGWLREDWVDIRVKILEACHQEKELTIFDLYRQLRLDQYLSDQDE